MLKYQLFCSITTGSFGYLSDSLVIGTEDLLHRTHYADDDRYQYDDNIDELFNLAEHLIKISHSRTNNAREGHDEQSSLIRMLYCCILPKILIYKKDWTRVERAVKQQMSYITKREQDIERDSQTLDESYKVLFLQQDERLHRFESIASEKKCTERFVIALDTDLQKRKHQLFEKIDTNQGVVQQLKNDIQGNGETEEKKQQLAEARKQSANMHALLQKILMASADTLKEALDSGGFQSKDNETVVLEYLSSREMSLRQKERATYQMEKKVRAMSILANLERIKDDINNDGVASAIPNRYMGVRPTDVISDSHVPEYQTLSERVATIVRNPEHPLGEEFEKFTRHIREYCQLALKNAELAKGGTDARKKHSSRHGNGFLVVDYDGTIEEELLTPLENLCSEIKNHCDQLARLFLEQFNSMNSELLRRKLQLCYEENFYNEVGKDIMKVFETAYRKYKDKMIHDLNILKTYPINCLDLQMKNEWWLELFEKRRQVKVASDRLANKSIPIKMDSCTPPSSETSSITSSSSRSSRSSSKDHGNESRSSDPRSNKTLRRIMNFVRRKSRDVTESLNDEDCRESKVSCFDDYERYRADNMSGAIVTNGGTLTNNEKENHISNNEQSIPDDISTTEDEHAVNGKPGDLILNSGSSADENDVEDSQENAKEEESKFQNELSKFAKYFGPSLDSLKDIFKMSSVFEKLKCLIDSVTKVTDSVQKLRSDVLEIDDNDYSLAITADDLLPLMVLIMLQMDSEDAASIVVELKMMQELIPKFLSVGCHNWALVEFEMASRVLQSLCTQFDWSTSFSSS
ncbi:uncharacterized protein LOC114516295 isoform X2 [Dendronephthya gigantea]|uniref:uncharacterized protein LOC114516295 isoform X2 n=1 Tax=Dendronephthya gigantea TaxID=151771 RepID=UPI00106CAE93|nr:uncharacterized protein LOC114516295 isoform X2 [Dendronephthya gigantea]